MKRYVLTPAWIMLLTLILCVSTYAASPEYRFTGSSRNFFIATDTMSGTDYELLSRLRLKLDIIGSEKLSAEIAYEIMPRYIDHSGSAVSALSSGPIQYRITDLNETIYEDPGTETSLYVVQNLDRANILISSESFDILIGRQPIAFGSARAVNPTDIIAPYSYNTLAKEERIGADAVRIKVPTDRLGEIDIGYVFGEDMRSDNNAAFFNFRAYILDTDMTLLTMMFRKNYMVGADLARAVLDAGVWLEASYVVAEGNDESYFRSSLGLDYSFTDKLYSYCEYHYNGAGKNDPDEYLFLMGKTAYTDGNVYLLGKHYLASGFTYQLTPLSVLSGQILINLSDGSFIISPGLEYSAADDINIQAGAFVGLGDDSLDLSGPGSEFGVYPDIYYLSLNIYF
ncbi:MAG: hypothetical protein JSV21_07315 [Nitrospirota bacterium]|nr:MAG: hypothetical protein JSV21_07315 [Nitrospirota bacterium]